MSDLINTSVFTNAGGDDCPFACNLYISVFIDAFYPDSASSFKDLIRSRDEEIGNYFYNYLCNPCHFSFLRVDDPEGDFETDYNFISFVGSSFKCSLIYTVHCYYRFKNYNDIAFFHSSLERSWDDIKKEFIRYFSSFGILVIASDCIAPGYSLSILFEDKDYKYARS